jgi:hypothetical protein
MANPKSITAANAQYIIMIPELFPAPQALQGYAADDVFSTDPIKTVEVSMGIDGLMSAGFVFIEIAQNIMLQANSPSVFLFDQWYQAMISKKDIMFAQGTVLLESIRSNYAMRNGVLTNYLPMPDAGKVLKPRRFTITWERVEPAPL